MIEFQNESGRVVGINPDHIASYTCYDTYTIIKTHHGAKYKVFMSEEEFRLVIRQVATAVCCGDLESPARGTEEVLRI